MTTSSAVDSGKMTGFGEALALVEEDRTISGTACLVDGVRREAGAVARGVAHRVEAMVAEVRITDHGALAEAAGVDQGAPV